MPNSAKDNVNLTGAAAGDFLDGGRRQTEGTLIEVHHPQKIGGKTLVGDITIHDFGENVAADPKFDKLRRKQGKRMSVVEADKLVGEPHHLFRLNGYVVAMVEGEASVGDAAVATRSTPLKREAETTMRPVIDVPTLEMISATESSTNLDALEVGASEGLRRFVAHLRIERSQAKAEEAKRHYRSRCAAAGKEPVCQACHESFADKYQMDYLEAHHKNSLGETEGSVATTVEDFDLLCANCHRAIHRLPQPALLADLQQVLRKRKL